MVKSPSARFGQLYRNITGSPHKPFNPQTFSNALTHFSMLAVLVFGFYWLDSPVRTAAVSQNGSVGAAKNRERSNWLQLPAMIIGAFIIDLLLLAPDIICRPGIKRQPECRQSHHRFPTKPCFSTPLPFIEFFKAVLRLIFCPNVAELVPVHDSGRERPLLESSPELGAV